MDDLTPISSKFLCSNSYSFYPDGKEFSCLTYHSSYKIHTLNPILDPSLLLPVFKSYWMNVVVVSLVVRWQPYLKIQTEYLRGTRTRRLLGIIGADKQEKTKIYSYSHHMRTICEGPVYAWRGESCYNSERWLCPDRKHAIHHVTSDGIWEGGSVYRRTTTQPKAAADVATFQSMLLLALDGIFGETDMTLRTFFLLFWGTPHPADTGKLVPGYTATVVQTALSNVTEVSRSLYLLRTILRNSMCAGRSVVYCCTYCCLLYDFRF